VADHIPGINAAKSINAQYSDSRSKFFQPGQLRREDTGGKKLTEPPKGTRGQLIGTILGIAAVPAMLLVLRLLGKV